ncbi:MAG: phosphate signaling complex protein PhoU [Tepidisphaeraceae bacterium]
MPSHFNQLLEALRGRVARMTANVQQVVEMATEAVFNQDVSVADRAIAADGRIDSEEVEIEKMAIELLAQHQPFAVDLRFVTSVIKVNSDFERIADCAVNAAQRVPVLARRREQRLPDALLLLCNAVTKSLRDTVNAFNLSDVGLADRVRSSDSAVDAYYATIVQGVISDLERKTDDDPNRDLALVMIAKNYERIGDHCTNIAEDIVYISSGQIVRHLHNA